MSVFTICNTAEEARKLRTEWGNSYFYITKEEIEALLAGKILASCVAGEYGLFIKMDEEEKNEN